jgi:hypothetical protein
MYTADMQSIDSKFDDGIPTSGSIQGLNWFSNCFKATNPGDPSTYTYNLFFTEQNGCALAFVNVLKTITIPQGQSY